MPDSLAFTHGVSELLWLLVHRPGDVSAQKAALRTAVLAGRTGPHRLESAHVGTLAADGVRLNADAREVAWASQLAARMSGHAVSVLEFAAPAPAAEVLAVARALALDPARNDDGLAFDARLVDMQLASVSAVLGGTLFVRQATPPMGTAALGAPPARTPRHDASPARPTPAAAAPTPGRAPAVAGARHADPVAATASAQARHAARADQGKEAARAMMESVLMRHTHPRSLDDLFIRLRGTLTRDSAPPLLDELGRAAEDYVVDGVWIGVLDVIERLMSREATAEDADVARAFGIQYRRLSKTGILRGIAQLLPHRKDARDLIHEFLRRMGEPAADVLLDLLIGSDKAHERAAYRAAIAQCPDTVKPLLHLLGDPRWFVVRNAAELLGEMEVTEAEEPLIAVLSHIDKRCRRAATHSLGRIGSKRALHAIAQRLSDEDSGVRLLAAVGLGASGNPRAVPLVLDAYRGEQDEEVQAALLAALGRSPTPEAIEKLAEESRPGSLLARRPQAVRLAAILALGEAGTVEARAALRRLLSDRDREIRLTAERSLRSEAQALAVSAP